MSCQKCNSERIIFVNGKCSDLCNVQIADAEHDGYVPDDIGVGGGDNISFEYCLDCGQMQGEFPIAKTELEQEDEDEDDS